VINNKIINKLIDKLYIYSSYKTTMSFNQLKVLVWRNLILKKRGFITTLLEFIIPSLLMSIIGIFCY